ncbi:hypothetical protein APHAL10511_003764 [Amanita phalloides]|nr:hypothetical protein APHAL10511_003764 [Amanita phalloides]
MFPPVSRPTTISRFPKRYASIDSPREVSLPSPSLLQQDIVSPFAVTFDSMDATTPFFTLRTNETVSNPARGSTSPSLSASSPHQMLPHTPGGKAITTPISENEQQAPTPPVVDRAERSLSSDSGASSLDATLLSPFDRPPQLVASSSSGSSASLESVASVSSDLWRNSNAVKSFNDSTAYNNRLSSSTFSSYTSTGLGSAYARPTQPSPYLTRHSNISLQFGGLSMRSSSSSYYLPPPEPPMILPLDPDPSENDDQNESESCGQNSGNTRQAPHVPFLNRGPPPTDSYIEAETTPRDYRVHVRLPGFGRDGITLATKKRRILHIVADQWEGVGVHFERRISFGYDADLVQVRAEFDGEMLLVIVPRRSLSLAFGIGYL